ncbi:MAG: hypothetical protein ACE5JL_19190 [Dehalococcoidia bacterium]
MVSRKLRKRVVFFAAIEEAQHEALRYIAFKERRSMADVAREAFENYIALKAREYPIGTLEVESAETVEVKASSR